MLIFPRMDSNLNRANVNIVGGFSAALVDNGVAVVSVASNDSLSVA